MPQTRKLSADEVVILVQLMEQVFEISMICQHRSLEARHPTIQIGSTLRRRHRSASSAVI